jgi:hypothetical protein
MAMEVYEKRAVEHVINVGRSFRVADHEPLAQLVHLERRDVVCRQVVVNPLHIARQWVPDLHLVLEGDDENQIIRDKPTVVSDVLFRIRFPVFYLVFEGAELFTLENEIERVWDD